MSGKLIDRLVAVGVFLVALVLYLLTVAPTASFWDSGEFIAIAHGLQVSHPPGAPFYMLVGRFFSMVFAPILDLFMDTRHIALAVNLVSVVASALTILLTHLVIVRLARIWKGHPDSWTPGQRLGALAGGVIGALTFAATDSFWFNAVEAEVYALSMFFTAIVVWLTLKWRDDTIAEEAELRARGEHPFGLRSDRILVLIAYLFGLAIGVHLLNVLTLFFIALIVYFVKFDRADWTPGRRALGVMTAGVVATVLFGMIYPGVVQMLPDFAERSGFPLAFTILLILLMTAAVWITQRRQMPVANLLALSFAMILIGYSSYALIFIRSAADPPIDENDPETAEAIVSYLKREQYGNTPLLTGATFDDRTGTLTREEVLFPRRWSPDPNHQRYYGQFDSDSDYFWGYQVNQMYVRYFLWNFVGKASDEQGARWISGLVPGETADVLYQSPSQRSSRNAYYGLPLLLGLLGLAFHFSRDWRRALSVLALFFMTGIGIILYLNQTPFQPRERDYSYVASFFAFSLWCGIGAMGLIELALGRHGTAHSDEEAPALDESPAAEGSRLRIAGLVAGLLFLAVPALMIAANYDDHDRSGRYIAPEFAANMLNSTAPNALIFTNGDNDTFPLWYAQEVEGIRQDVRVVNLSLLNTPWYIKQLRDQWSHTSEPLPITLTDQEVERLGFQEIPTGVTMTLPVDAARLSSEMIDGAGLAGDSLAPVAWRVEGRPHPYTDEAELLQVSDRMTLHIIQENARNGWERPIYFASTIARASELGLQPYFQNEGLARRLVPIASDTPGGRVVPEVAMERLNSFQFTNLADPDVYYDENIRQMADNYRAVFATIAEALASQGRTTDARALLDRVEAEVASGVIPPDFYSLYTLSTAYEALGDSDRVVEIMARGEDLALHFLQSPSNSEMQTGLQYAQFIQQTYIANEAFDEVATFSGRIADTIGDDSFRLDADTLRRAFEQDRPPAASDAAPASGEAAAALPSDAG
ncbi:MAG: DUF2723 domain-containing protein [Bacteroidota bacterium]